MQDRVPLYPGRVSLTPVSGNIYDMTMADQPQVVGTPLNKANLLSDAAAQAVWPDAADRPSDPVPSEAFIALGANVSDKIKVLLDLIAPRNIGTTGGRGDPLTVSLSDNIEEYRIIEIWAMASTLSNPDMLIDVSSGIDATKRLCSVNSSGNYPTFTKLCLFVNNDTDGHNIFSIATSGSSNHYIQLGGMYTGTAKLSGNVVTLSVSSTSTYIASGSHFLIVGYKF